MLDNIEKAMAAIKVGDKSSSKQLLHLVLESNPNNEMAWLWLATLSDSNEECRKCLTKVLEINPDNHWAKQNLTILDGKEPAKTSLLATQIISDAQIVHPSPLSQPKTEARSLETQVQLSDSHPEIDPPAPAYQPPKEEEEMTLPLNNSELEEAILESEVAPASQNETRKSGTYDVFISYSRKNKPFVQKLYETLLAEERDVWVDWGNIPLSVDWRAEIYEGIEKANAIIFVISPDFLASKECLAELEIAQELHKRLIPIIIRDVDSTQVPQVLAALNWLFFRRGDNFETAYQSLVETIDTDPEWVKTHTRLLVRANEWEQEGHNNSFLLRGVDLKEAEFSLANAGENPDPTLLQRQYVLSSREYETKLQRRRMVIISIIMISSILLAISAFFGWGAARNERNQAQRQSKLAVARKLGAEAIIYAANQPDLAVLLSLEATNIEQAQQVKTHLLADLRNSPYLDTILHGHTANVRSVVFSPDGSILASGSKDKTIRLWDTVTHQPLGNPLQGHTDRVTQIAFSPDGKILASSSRDNTIRLWDVESRQALGDPLVGHTDRVNSLAFSPDGTTLVSGSHDKSLILWDVNNGQAIGTPLSAHKGAINSVVFNPNGKIVASGGRDNSIIVWDVNKRQPLGPPLRSHTGWINALAFSPDGRFLASGSSDSNIRLWDVSTAKPQGLPFTGHPTSITSLAFSPDGTMLASGSEDDTIILWNTEFGHQLGWPLMGHANSVLGLSFSPDGETLASASSDATIVLWDISVGKFFAGHTSVVRSVDFSPDGSIIASGSSDHSIRLWDSKTEEIIMAPLATGSKNNGVSITGHSDEIQSVAFNPAGTALASGSNDDSIILWNVADGQPYKVLTGHQDDVLSVAFNPTGSLLASGSADKSIILWDTNTLEKIKVLEGHTGQVKGVGFSPDEALLASASSDNNVIVWDIKSGKPLYPPLSGHEDDVNSVAFSPDGKILASGSHDSFIIIWDAESGQEIDRIEGHVNRVTSVAFSPDGKTLASGSYDKNIMLWHVESRTPVGPPLIGHTNDVTSLAWSPDNKQLVSGGWDNMLILWEINFNSWQQRACHIANRTLTQAEWNNFVNTDTIPYTDLCSDYLAE